MGLANDSLTWPDAFIDLLRNKGYDVIRFDNRDVGMSTWMNNKPNEKQYDLDDMADDAIAVMDHLALENAHIVGVSMGGMIGQTMSIKYPNRVKSLSTMMSSGYPQDNALPKADKWIIAKFLYAQARYGLSKTEEGKIRLQLIAWHLLRGKEKYDINIADTARTVLKNIRHRRGYNPKASRQQLSAIYKSGSRYEKLKDLFVPTLVIHGKGDPLVRIEHGYKCAEIIPNAQSLWIEGMGHTLPEKYFKEIVEAIDLRINSSEQS
jgi:pimeloyl-ACP methyl ester carboxylesterase